jgi:hypothetical protein
VRVEVGDGAGERLALEVHGHLDLHLLTAPHDDEVEVLDDLAHRVLLHVLHQGELALARDLQVEEGVRLADEQGDLVAREGQVLRVGPVTVEHGRNLAGGADLAGRALAERVARVGDDLVVFVHGGSPCGLTGPRSCVCRFDSNART